jgi:hypothetical protein
MTFPSPFAGLTYDARDDDLVRFRENPVDDTLSHTVRSIFDSLDEHREEVRLSLDEDDRDLLQVFARRRALSARRANSLRAVSDALDSYALLPLEHQVPWESWFKATLFIGRDLGLDLDDALQRFTDGAPDKSAERAHVAFDAMSRIDSISQCHVIEVSTTYGIGLIESTVIRDQGLKSWGGITGQPVTLGQFHFDYEPTTNLAQLTVDVADALEASGHVQCSSIRQDQLVDTAFDLVTSGSYLDSLGCLSFFADGVEGQPSFAVNVAEVASEEHDDMRFEAVDLSRELAEAADAIEEQSALATGPCLVMLCALPSFEEDASDEPIDLSSFLEVVRAAIVPDQGESLSIPRDAT